MLNYLATLFYPKFCRFCNVLISQDSIFCLNCYSTIKPIVSRYLQVTPKKSMKVFAVSDYKDPLRRLVLKKAYSEILASKQLAQILLEKTVIKNLDFDFIVPIPLHWTRYSRRGYNQANVMGMVLSKKLQKPVLNLLRRNRKTVFQAKLSNEKRHQNVKDVFDISFRYKFNDLSFLQNKNILLIDDLCTTGATLKSAARVLINFKPKTINSIVVCRVV
ncbi:ComF family protein [Candidatus Dependentiae bacterium]